MQRSCAIYCSLQQGRIVELLDKIEVWKGVDERARSDPESGSHAREE
jgi:hypothetical protein